MMISTDRRSRSAMIGLADLLRALCSLNLTTSDHQKCLLRSLGIDVVDINPAQQRKGVSDPLSLRRPTKLIDPYETVPLDEKPRELKATESTNTEQKSTTSESKTSENKHSKTEEQESSRSIYDNEYSAVSKNTKLDQTDFDASYWEPIASKPIEPLEPRSIGMQRSDPDRAMSHDVSSTLPASGDVPSSQLAELSIEKTDVEYPEWLSTISPLPRSNSDVKYFPLLESRTERGVIMAAISTQWRGKQLALTRIVQARSRLQPLPRLFFETRPSLRRGVQLLLDVSDGMAPFFCDLRDLEQSFNKILGGLPMLKYEFCESPFNIKCENFIEQERSWRPSPRSPLIIASDLGAGINSFWSRGIWRKISAMANELSCPVVIFNPLPPGRWPRIRERHITIIHWAPYTRASAIRRLIGPGHEIDL